MRIVLCLPFSRIFLSVSVLCQSVSASILLPQRYFVSARMSALPLFKRKTGVPHSRFCPFFAFFCTFFAHFCTFSRRGQALLSARVHYMPKLKFAPFALFARFFIFPWARQKNVSIRFSHHSTFFCRCQHLCRKALHGRAR